MRFAFAYQQKCFYYIQEICKKSPFARSSIETRNICFRNDRKWFVWALSRSNYLWIFGLFLCWLPLDKLIIQQHLENGSHPTNFCREKSRGALWIFEKRPQTKGKTRIFYILFDLSPFTNLLGSMQRHATATTTIMIKIISSVNVIWNREYLLDIVSDSLLWQNDRSGPLLSYLLPHDFRIMFFRFSLCAHAHV